MTLGELIGPEAKLPAAWRDLPIGGLAADSREVKPGYLFAAMPGVKADGASFIADAVARGAAAILVAEGTSSLNAQTPVVVDGDVRRRLALIAARFYGMQPKTAVAVTGTNGKTSVASFLRQLWAGQGHQAGSLGTVGVVGPRGTTTLKHTTPDPIELHAILAALAKEDVTHLALEASSHGLQQRRVDGVMFAAGAFTNLSRDHLDYHASVEDYFAQKLRLFTELLPEGASAVVDVDSDEGVRVAEAAKARGLELISVGRSGKSLRLISAEINGFGQTLNVEINGTNHKVRLPLVGAFQASNALVAAGLAIATGGDVETVLPLLESLHGARGRLDVAGTSRRGAPVFIDYAHTPDALAKALDALRPYVGNRLVVVFGCGGDRDKGKRPEMGRVAAEKADLVIVTDDNPRSERPEEIRRQLLAAVPSAHEIGDRGAAIAEAVAWLERGDVLLVAGKGHETGQTFATTVIPFSDHDAVEAVLKEETKVVEPLWTLGDIVIATAGSCLGASGTPVTGFSIDTRSLKPGEGFVAISGPNRDGHAFVGAALDQGAACAIVNSAFTAGDEERLVRVADTFKALNDLGRASRARARDTMVIAVTGSVGKTGTKEALKIALASSGSVHASSKSFNNHWGVPLSLANMPRDTRFGVFEAGMNHAGEIDGLTRLIRPHIAIVTTVAPVHLGFFRSVEDIADAKAEIFRGLEPGGAAILNRDNTHYERLKRHALEHGARIVGFGEADGAEARLLEAELSPDGSRVVADILGEKITYALGAPGRHIVQNSLAVLAAAKLAGAGLALAALALSQLKAQAGRGARLVVPAKNGRVAIIDESYNANPASMRAAIATLGLTPRGEFNRRVAVLGDMLELGSEGARLHADLADFIDGAGVDVVFACGELMGSLYRALPPSRRGAYAGSAEELAPMLTQAVGAGDVIMVKGSLGSRMAPLVEALKRHFEAEDVSA
jgi:MurE/MurF fusion protein